MRYLIAFCFLLVGCSDPVEPIKPKDCAELRDRIHDKVKARGVKHFELVVVDSEVDPKKGRVVGTCADGSKKILYFRRTAWGL